MLCVVKYAFSQCALKILLYRPFGGLGLVCFNLGAFGTFCCTADMKNSGFSLFFPFSQVQQEKAEWENINKALMRHGLKPVSLAAPQSCRDTSGKEM